MKLGVLATHPIQYHAPLYRALAQELDLQVYFAHLQTAQGQADAGFGVAFEWDVPLTDGYSHTFLDNRSSRRGSSSFSGCNTPEIASIIRREKFDAFLVNGWYTRSYWQAMAACWGSGTPLLVRGDSHLQTPRAGWKRAAKEVGYRAFVPRFDGYLVVGQRTRAYYLHYGADPERMHFVPHFVDAEFFQSQAAAADPSDLRSRYGVPDDATVFLFAGKFIDVKRPLDFVEAMALLSRQGAEVAGVMVGDGPLRPQVEAAIERTGAPVQLAGFLNQSEMPGAYALSDVLVLPSRTETWGLVVNEAMACGRPAVVSDAVGCAPDLIDEGTTGMTYPAAGGAAPLARAMEAALSLPRRRTTREALAAKTETYSLRVAVEGTLRAVHAVSDHPAPR